MRVVNQKLRKAIECAGRVARIEGSWWQFSLTERSIREPSAVSLLRVSRDRDGALELTGRSWQEDGSLSARHWSEAAKDRKEPRGYFTTHSDTHPKVNARTSGVYLRADPGDLGILDGRDDGQRAELIAERLKHWKSIANA